MVDFRFRRRPPRIQIVVLLIGIPIILTASGLAAEALYRAKVRSEFASLERSVLSAHAGTTFRGARHFRFGGDEVKSLEPSLMQDAFAALSRELGLSSRLDYPMSDDEQHAYYLVAFEFNCGTGRDYYCHVFLWSPRIRQFVHYMNWDYYKGCPLVDCRWRPEPERARRARAAIGL